jgi:hypothetical protein
VEVLAVVTVIPASAALALLMQLGILRIVLWLLQPKNAPLLDREFLPSSPVQRSICSEDVTKHSNASVVSRPAVEARVEMSASL